MKKTIIFIFLLCNYFVFSQDTFNYQAVLRDDTGAIMANQTGMHVQYTLLLNDLSPYFRATDLSVSTNAYGVFNIKLGDSNHDGCFCTPVEEWEFIDWSQRNLMLEIAVDLDGNGPQAMTVIGTSSLLSVPYANHAITSTATKTISDTDGDTNILLEKSPDNDKIIFQTDYQDRWLINGYQLESLDARENVLVGNGAGRTINTPASIATGNSFFGWDAGNSADDTNNNTAIGALAFSSDPLGSNNVAIGSNSMANAYNVNGSVAIGLSALDNSQGDYNTGIGTLSMEANYGGSSNVAVGFASLRNADSSNNVGIGSYAGDTSAGSGVFLGHHAGRYEVTSNKLYIDNSSSNTPLVYGDFFNNTFRVGGKLEIGNQDNATPGSVYGFPTVDGSASQALLTDGAGNLNWSSIDTDPINEIELPTGGVNGQILATDGSGNYSWITNTDLVNDADADPTNEIELPVGGTNGQLLSTDGSGTYSWVNKDLLPANGNSGDLLVSDGANSGTWTNSPVLSGLQVNNYPAFTVYKFGGVFPEGSALNPRQITSWGSNIYNNGNHFNNASGHFVAPVSGIYFFSANMNFNVISSGILEIAITRNEGPDSEINAVQDIPQSAPMSSFNTSGVIYLNAGDSASVLVKWTGSGIMNVSTLHGSSFSGYLIMQQ